MVFEKFVTEIKTIWSQYLTYVSTIQARGSIYSNGGRVLYPNILLVTNCSGFYAAELIGATSEFNGLAVKRHKEKSIYRYFSQFDDSETDSLVCMDASSHSFRFLYLAQEADFEALANRFPSIVGLGPPLEAFCECYNEWMSY